jgi:hypothetical protein
MRRGCGCLLLVGLLLAGAAQAHVASNGFLDLEVRDREVRGALELAVRDVELAVGVDANRDRRVTWGELRAAEPRLASYVAQHLTLHVENASCALVFGPLKVNARVDGNYAWLSFAAHCPRNVRQLVISYTLLDGIDPSHRGLLRLQSGTLVQTAVLGGSASSTTLEVDRASPWRAAVEYLEAGIWHIWSGIDHLLFLLSLLLPSVLVRRGQRWDAVDAAQPAFWSVLKVVTAFTLAHSITLSLAAFDLVRLPSRLTESAIAASIIVAALNNLYPIVTEARARIAFAFGLLHGFGFASVLADMGLPSGARLVSLVSFNLGIEAGQLAVVLTVMPVAYAMRRGELYRSGVLPLGSAAIAGLALIWFVQRAFLPI